MSIINEHYYQRINGEELADLDDAKAVRGGPRESDSCDRWDYSTMQPGLDQSFIVLLPGSRARALTHTAASTQRTDALCALLAGPHQAGGTLRIDPGGAQQLACH
jgi:hypothetical protein